MIDVKLTAGEWDLALSDAGDLILIGGSEETVQHIKQRLLTFLGEWFLDLQVGVPWLQKILGKSSDLATVEAILRDTIRQSPGVLELTSFEISGAETERAVSVTFTVSLTTGEETISLEI